MKNVLYYDNYLQIFIIHVCAFSSVHVIYAQSVPKMCQTRHDKEVSVLLRQPCILLLIYIQPRELTFQLGGMAK